MLLDVDLSDYPWETLHLDTTLCPESPRILETTCCASDPAKGNVTETKNSVHTQRGHSWRVYCEAMHMKWTLATVFFPVHHRLHEVGSDLLVRREKSK